MTFERFNETIRLIVKSSQDLSAAYDLGIDLLEFTETQAQIQRHLWSSILTSEGLEWLDWFLYEKDYVSDGIGRPDMNAYHDGEEIVKDVEGLYQYLTENNYFKCESPK